LETGTSTKELPQWYRQNILGILKVFSSLMLSNLECKAMISWSNKKRPFKLMKGLLKKIVLTNSTKLFF
jgi:hypothetical protein